MTIWITTHKGKMDGIRSISTNPLTNSFCKSMSSRSSTSIICRKCYASVMMRYRASLQAHVENNSQELSERIIPVDELPTYNDELMRFNSFGEIINTNHLINLFNICYKNPNTHHTLFTKRMSMVEEFCYLKPSNLIIVESNPFINSVLGEPLSPMADIVFNVVTEALVNNNKSVVVNCTQSCNKCRKCYTKNVKTRSIVELLK